MEYSINPQMTGNDLVPPNKTKSTTNDKHHKRSDLLTLSLPNVAKGKFRPNFLILINK